MSVKIGQKAPNFELPDQTRAFRSLKDFSGKKIVLAFFPGAFTSVCTKEMCKLRDSEQIFRSVGAEVVGISVNDPFTNKAFSDANNLRFPILSDYKRKTVKKYNIRHANFAGLNGYTAAKRSVYILDLKGVVRFKWVSEDPSKEPSYEDIWEFVTKAFGPRAARPRQLSKYNPRRSTAPP
jgi:peroxiredoxin